MVEVSVQTWVIVAAVATSIVVCVLALRSRGEQSVELAIVPTSSFDPSMEDVVRYAAHLVRARRVRDGVARPIRISLKAVGEGQLVQTITVPESAVGMLRRHGLAEVELISMDELDRRLAGVAAADSSQPDPDRTEMQSGAGSDRAGDGRPEGGRANDGAVAQGRGVLWVDPAGGEVVWPDRTDGVEGVRWSALQEGFDE